MNLVETGVGAVKALDRWVHDDDEGAAEAIKATPLYQAGEHLVDSFKELGDGIYNLDGGKIINGLVGIGTNELTEYIPVIGKGVKVTAKVAKKVTQKTLKKTARKGVRNTKDDIAKKGFKKEKPAKKKEKENQKDKNKQCPAKNDRPKRAARKRRKKDCDDDKKDKCPKPNGKPGAKGQLIGSYLQACKNNKAKGNCYYLCQPGYDETPKSLTCQDKKKMESTISWM